MSMNIAAETVYQHCKKTVSAVGKESFIKISDILSYLAYPKKLLVIT